MNYCSPRSKRRGSQVVRRGSAKALCVGSIPTLASISNSFDFREILRVFDPQNPLINTGFNTRNRIGAYRAYSVGFWIPSASRFQTASR